MAQCTCMKHEYINYTMYMYEITCMKHEYMYNVCQTENLDITKYSSPPLIMPHMHLKSGVIS